MALMTEPAPLIADETTTALDATLELQIIHRLQQLQRDFGCAILFISHHLGVIAELCDEVVVMYAGEVVESGPTRDVFLKPRHPYTRKLLECDPARINRVAISPSIDARVSDQRWMAVITALPVTWPNNEHVADRQGSAGSLSGGQWHGVDAQQGPAFLR